MSGLWYATLLDRAFQETDDIAVALAAADLAYRECPEPPDGIVLGRVDEAAQAESLAPEGASRAAPPRGQASPRAGVDNLAQDSPPGPPEPDDPTIIFAGEGGGPATGDFAPEPKDKARKHAPTRKKARRLSNKRKSKKTRRL